MVHLYLNGFANWNKWNVTRKGMIDKMESTYPSINYDLPVYIMITTIVTVLFMLLVLLWRYMLLYCSSSDKSQDSPLVSQYESRNDGNTRYETMEFKSIVKNPPKKHKGSVEIPTTPKIRLESSSSQYSLNTFMNNKNSSRILIDQKGLIMNYSVLLSERNETLNLNLISVENLRPNSVSELRLIDKLDVYVKVELVYVSKDENLVRKSAKTRQIKKRSNAVFDETFEFCDYQCSESTYSDNKCGIFFFICNNNVFGRDQLLGKHVQSLKTSDLINKEHSTVRKKFTQNIEVLDPKAHDSAILGQLQMTLLFKQLTKSIYINIIKGIDLKIPGIYLNSEKTPSVFIKVYLLYKGQCIQKIQTKVISNTVAPVFNESFDLCINDLLEMSRLGDVHSKSSNQPSSTELLHKVATKLELVFLVMDEDKCEKTDAIGQVHLNNQEYSPDTSDWFDIFSEPDRPLEFTYDIKNV